eukprot:CAMPEP_0185204830 /NCGR_PEP_ID=MMETSP1140-20130426/55554_1 /TAXON_ID=298111 /ORGANISM="Pavlova sp., Strain CCMP459" /LENGTH=69 /DNA_ID=CAMNT_0027772399 /DNA_START=45 /DNA_END=254 /DNA_ORIENTATION=+
MKLTMSYQIPQRITRIVESGPVQTFVSKYCLEPTLRQFGRAMELERERASSLVGTGVSSSAAASQVPHH